MPLTIPNGTKFTIKPIGKTDGFDGHSMRAQKYFADQMPDIVEALAKADTATKFWIDDEGEYCCE